MSSPDEYNGGEGLWPISPIARMEAVETLLRYAGVPLKRDHFERYFVGAPAAELDATLRYLQDLGLILETEGRFHLPPPREE